MKIQFLFCFNLLSCLHLLPVFGQSNAQKAPNYRGLENRQIDSISALKQEKSIEIVKCTVSPQEFYEPLLMMTYGLVKNNNHVFHGFDRMLKFSIQNNVGPKRHVDDYIQYVPAIAFLGMDFVGVKAKHSLKDRLLYGAAVHVLMGATVNIMKNSMSVRRPDLSGTNFFPSGHTATAFSRI